MSACLPGCPLVSCIMTRSDTLLALQARTSAATSWFPLFIRWAPGNISFTSCRQHGGMLLTDLCNISHFTESYNGSEISQSSVGICPIKPPKATHSTLQKYSTGNVQFESNKYFHASARKLKCPEKVFKHFHLSRFAKLQTHL